MDCKDCKNYKPKPKKIIVCFLCGEPAVKENITVKVCNELWQIYYCLNTTCQLGVFGVVE